MLTKIKHLVFLVFALSFFTSAQAATTLIPDPVYCARDLNGIPLSGGKLFSYAAGTSTPQATYTDSTGGVSNANPVILDSTGCAHVWLGNNSYKFNLLDTNSVQQSNYPVDNITRYTSIVEFNALASTTYSTQGSGSIGYKYSTASATIGRTVKSRLQDFVTDADCGAVNDFSTDNTSAIQGCLNSFPAGGTNLYIRKGTKWNGGAVTYPTETTVTDDSGWDWKNSQWTGQVKIITQTDLPGSKNANEYQLISNYHPAYIIDNTSGGSDYRGSIVWRHNGSSDWQLTTDEPQAPGTERRIQFSFYGTYAGVPSLGGTNVFGINPYEGNWGFNTIPQSGIDWYFQSVRNNTSIKRYQNLTNQGWDVQYANATNGLILRQSISGVDGSFYYTINGIQSDFHTANSEIYGNRIFVSPKTNGYTVAAQDSGKTFTNQNAIGGETLVLPPAVTGLNYRFSVRAAQNMRIDPDGSDYFIGFQAGSALSTKAAGKYMESALVGAILEIKCSEAGTWDFVRYGVWTDE